MRRLIPRLVIAAAVAAATAAGTSPRATLGSVTSHAARGVPSVACEAPRALRLERFEDGSAKLLCAGRLLVRVSVPW